MVPTSYISPETGEIRKGEGRKRRYPPERAKAFAEGTKIFSCPLSAKVLTLSGEHPLYTNRRQLVVKDWKGDILREVQKKVSDSDNANFGQIFGSYGKYRLTGWQPFRPEGQDSTATLKVLTGTPDNRLDPYIISLRGSHNKPVVTTMSTG